MKKTLRVLAYIRVSTDEQADKGNSLSEQQERLSAYCVAMGWDSPIFIVDDGYSAKDLKRPGIQQMIEKIEKNEYDIVLTSKLDRLCRNLLDLLQIVEFFADHKCSYVSASESFDTSTAVGRMTLQLLGTFAEFERERISERVKDNMMSLAKNTDKALTLPCFGYDIVDGRYQINEEEAQHVRYMFELGEQGHGHRKIAQLLNARGSTTKRGKPWDQINVKRIMKTETVAGILVYNKRQTSKGKVLMRDPSEWVTKENHHAAIIPPEQFRKVNEIMNLRSIGRKHADSESYLLTGLVKCKYCGGGMKGATSRHQRQNNQYTYYRYICSSYVLGYGCKHHAVHRDDLENFVISRIVSLAKAGGAIQVKIAASPTVEDEIKELKAQFARIDKRMQKQIEAFENDLISAEDLRQARERVESERRKIEAELVRLKSVTSNIDHVKRRAEDLLEDITGTDRVKAKNAIRQVVDYVEVEGAVVDVTYKP